MKVLYIEWNSYGGKTIEKLFLKRGYELIKCPFNSHMMGASKLDALRDISDNLKNRNPDYVFSYDYFPSVSEACMETCTPYFSWIYDSPVLDIYHYSVPNPINRIFLFDRGVYDQFAASGIKTVYHLPLGVDNSRHYVSPTAYISDISFVGSLYNEPKHRLYDKFAGISEYSHGYLDGIIEAQKHIYGYNFLENLLTPDILDEMQKAYPTDPNASTVMQPSQLYSSYVLSRQVTATERYDILSMIGTHLGRYCNRLYTNDANLSINGFNTFGPVDYYSEMPEIFNRSRINLNITLRSILTGIPLRALDIMSCGGFLLSNYQEELVEYFVPGEDFDYYSDYDDLLNKLDYYLTHEKERARISENGALKVRAEHSLDQRVNTMEDYL